MDEHKEKMNIETVVAVLNQSKKDIYLDDILSEIYDEELIEFAEEYDAELADFLILALPIIMDRLKLRMVMAKSGEEEQE